MKWLGPRLQISTTSYPSPIFPSRQKWWEKHFCSPAALSPLCQRPLQELQSGFRDSVALMKNTNNVLLLLTLGFLSILTLLAPTAAFDTTSHTILIVRPSVTDTLLWFTSYLSGQTQFKLNSVDLLHRTILSRSLCSSSSVHLTSPSAHLSSFSLCSFSRSATSSLLLLKIR